jgi:hypothetical protein
VEPGAERLDQSGGLLSKWPFLLVDCNNLTCSQRCSSS